MRPGVDSISLNDEGVLRVILTGDAVSAQLALLGEPRSLSEGALLIYCDLRELFDQPDDIPQRLQDRLGRWEEPLDEPLLQWLLETVSEPDACVELGFVSESAGAVLEEFLEQQDILNRQGRAIERLSELCETLAAAVARAPEADLAARVINQLKSRPSQGMADGEPNYWDEIYGFTDHRDEMPARAIEDIQDLASKLVESLPSDLSLAIRLGEVSVHDWILEKIEDDEVPLYSGQVDFGSEDLTAQVVEQVLDQAVNFDPSLRQVSHEEAEELFRAARTRLQGLAREALPKTNAGMLELVDSVLTYQQNKKIYDQHEALGSALFGAQWQRQKTDWAVLERLSAWVIKLHDDLGNGQIPQGIIAFLAGHTDASGLGDAVTGIEQHVVGLDKALRNALEVTGMQAENAIRPDSLRP